MVEKSLEEQTDKEFAERCKRAEHARATGNYALYAIIVSDLGIEPADTEAYEKGMIDIQLRKQRLGQLRISSEDEKVKKYQIFTKQMERIRLHNIYADTESKMKSLRDVLGIDRLKVKGQKETVPIEKCPNWVIGGSALTEYKTGQRLLKQYSR
jgi:hypothetical protein